MSPVRHASEPSPAQGGRSDAQLLADHVDGDPSAFEHLLRRHEQRLWAVALRTCRDPHEAQDALQDALLSAHRGASSFRGTAAVSTWLHRIVVNACLDRIRRRRPVREFPDDDALTLWWGTSQDPTGRVDDRLRLQQALDGLPEAQRLAVLLVDVEGYSVADAAAALGTAPGTVKSRCSRGRAALAALLRPAPEPPAPAERQRSWRASQREGPRHDG